MASYPNTGSTLVDGQQNRTGIALSTNIIIQINNSSGSTTVGAIQSLTVNEAGNIKMIDEVGTDGHIDSVRHSSVNVSGSCERVRFDGIKIAEAFSRGFVHVHSQIYPFDIYIIDKNRKETKNYITTVIKNVWLRSIDTTYSAADFVLVDKMNWDAETIYSYFPNQSSQAAIGIGTRTIITTANSPSLNGIEQDADRGLNNRRGSLDAGGLIDIGSTGDLF